jgi:hypothetical protein
MGRSLAFRTMRSRCGVAGAGGAGATSIVSWDDVVTICSDSLIFLFCVIFKICF